MDSIFDITVQTIDGRPQPMADYRGRLLLIVNVASRCGFTPQYAGLEALWQRFGGRGLVVMGFPCNQFAGQEPGDEAEIASFCSTTYGVSFPMFAKIDVNGDGAHPLYRHLKAAAPGILGSEAIKWNFTKFLVGRDGKVLARYASKDTPESLAVEIEKAL
jgi:glutathione peroxidase